MSAKSLLLSSAARNVRPPASVFYNVAGRPLDTFSNGTGFGFTAIKTQTSLDARCGIDALLMVAGRRYRTEFYLDMASGTAPRLEVRASAITGLILTISTSLVAGFNRVDFTNPALGANITFNWSTAGWVFNGAVSKFSIRER